MQHRHHRISYYIINGITMYRVLAAPVLMALLFTDNVSLFKWLLVISFFTDSIDGFLARKYKVTSKFGTRLDSIGDDLTVFAATLGLFVVHPVFIRSHLIPLGALFALFLVQTGYAFWMYGRPSGFHTYMAKLAAISQAIFLVLAFFLPQPIVWLFYVAIGITALQLKEEIMLVRMLPQWRGNVKGLWWVCREQRKLNK
ncbi:MAG: CDP-alcohol phosphatidyltransferase family protein [Chitinophagaceae bacterium]|nr:CDP-alcohol phosphatidyltransferase family protein [Chitinophagaceae bacterium]MBK8953736.1 CDP-alcohol phosphatidyltransferase family protein [Chitinophagaceae bacterium]